MWIRVWGLIGICGTDVIVGKLRHFVMDLWHGAEARYEETICEAVSSELHLEGVVEPFCRQSGTCSGLGEEIRGPSDLTCQRKQSALPLYVWLVCPPFLELRWRRHLPLTAFVSSQVHSHIHVPSLVVHLLYAWKEDGFILAMLQQCMACCCVLFCLYCLRSWGTSAATTHLVPWSCVSFAWHVPGEMLSSILIFLIIRHHFS